MVTGHDGFLLGIAYEERKTELSWPRGVVPLYVRGIYNCDICIGEGYDGRMSEFAI